MLPDLERTAEAMPTRLYRITAEVMFPSPSGGKRKYALATTRIGPRDRNDRRRLSITAQHCASGGGSRKRGGTPVRGGGCTASR